MVGPGRIQRECCRAVAVCFGFLLIISGGVKHAVADVTQICWMVKGQTGKWVLRVFGSENQKALVVE